MYYLIGVLVLLIIFLVLISLLASRNPEYKELVLNFGDDLQLGFMAPASLYLIDKSGTYRRFSKAVQKIHEKIIKIYGSKEGWQKTQLFMAQALSAALLILVLFTFLSVMAEADVTLFIFGIILSILTVLILFKDLDRKIVKREHEMLIELPEYLNKIIMLVGAGETVVNSIIKSAEPKIEIDEVKNPLYKELKLAINELKMNRSFEETMEDFSRRCALPEVSIFTTSILLNHRKGGSDFTSSLRELSRELWDKRKAIAKIQGEEASSKMVFPMVFVFLIILVIIATPAMMLM